MDIIRKCVFICFSLFCLIFSCYPQNIETITIKSYTELDISDYNVDFFYFDKKNEMLYSNGRDNGFVEIDLTDLGVKEITLRDNAVSLNMVPDLRFAETKYDFSITRYPYKNNTIILEGLSRGGEKEWVNYVYDLNKQEIIKCLGFIYNFYYFDSDRRWIHHTVETPEYTLAIESGWLYWLIDKDNTSYSYYGSENNDLVVELLMNEFKNSVFEEPYIFETIHTINKSFNGIITRYECSARDGIEYILQDYNNYKDGKFDEINHILVYFFSRMEHYFGINMYAELDKYEKRYRASSRYYDNYNYMELDIYENGFYCFDMSNRLTVFDITNKKVINYQVEIPLGINRFYIKGISLDGKKCYVTTANSILIYDLVN